MRLCRSFLQTLGFPKDVSSKGMCQLNVELVYKMFMDTKRKLDPLNMDCVYSKNNTYLTFNSPRFGSFTSLSSLSSLSLVILCTFICKLYPSIRSVSSCSYIVSLYKTFIFGNANACSDLISLAILSGLNLSYVLYRLVRCISLCVSGLIIRINPISFSGSNPIHYILVIGLSNSHLFNRQHNVNLINVVGKLGSIGILVYLSYE